MENHYSNIFQNKIIVQSIFDNIVSILTSTMRRVEFYLSSSPWKMLRPYVTPMEWKQHGCPRQILNENRFSHRNYERFAIFRQLKMDKIVLGCDSRGLQGDVSSPGFEVYSSIFAPPANWRELISK